MYRLNKANIFLVLCLAFIAGIGWRSVIDLSWLIIFSIGIFGMVMSVVFWSAKKVRVIFLVLLSVAIGVGRYELAVPKEGLNFIHHYNDKEIRFVGLVKAEPDVRSDHVKLTVAARQIVEPSLINVKGDILVNAQLYPAYQYGDLLDITCKLQAPEPIEDDEGGRVFAYDKYLARFDIYSLCYRPSIELLATDQGNLLMQIILNTKKLFTERIAAVIPEPEASFVGGLILGARKSIPDDLIEAFNVTGTTHIIALSGYNITIIAVFIQNFCRILWIPRKKSFWIAITVITFFIIMTGAPASVVRAGIMGGLVLLARQMGRMSRVTNLLILAAVVMLLINPKVLFFDAGFQLSFLATIGLVYLSPLLEKVFHKLPNTFALRSSLVATMSAIILTTPLILLTFGRLSIIAPLVNVIILPLIPLAMAMGFLTGLASLIWLPLGTMVGWLAWSLLRLILMIIEWFATLPNISHTLPPLHGGWGVIAYFIILVVLYKFRKKPGRTMSPSVDPNK